MGNVVQSDYNRYAPDGAAGMAATMHGWDADTKQATETIGFGLAVSKGTGDTDIVKGGSLYVGVSMRNVTLDPATHTNPDQYVSGDNVPVMTRGDIWVEVEDAVVAQTAVTYNTTTGQLGSSGGTAISGAVWKTSADAGGLAIARLNGAEDVTT